MFPIVWCHSLTCTTFPSITVEHTCARRVRTEVTVNMYYISLYYPEAAFYKGAFTESQFNMYYISLYYGEVVEYCNARSSHSLTCTTFPSITPRVFAPFDKQPSKNFPFLTILFFLLFYQSIYKGKTSIPNVHSSIDISIQFTSTLWTLPCSVGKC